MRLTQWIKNHSYILLNVLGYAVFVGVAYYAFRLLISDKIGMDSLIAFLLSQALGMLVLHGMRRAGAKLLSQRQSAHQYGIFLLVNAVVVLFNAFVMYVMDMMSSYHETSLQMFATLILLWVNIIMQLLQQNPPVQEE